MAAFLVEGLRRGDVAGAGASFARQGQSGERCPVDGSAGSWRLYATVSTFYLVELNVTFGKLLVKLDDRPLPRMPGFRRGHL
jgi:hypothetical protein